MDHNLSASGDELGGEPSVVRDTTDYFRRLLIEEPYIRAALTNPGASIVLQGAAATTDAVSNYSSQIGNDFHCDLIQMDTVLEDDFSKQERDALHTWSYGMSSQQAAHWQGVKGNVVRKRRQRAVERLATKMNEE